MTDPTLPACLERQAFDEAAFGRPFYRVTSMDGPGLERGVATLREYGAPFIIDAKASSDDLSASRLLQALGFRKVCIQIELVHDLSSTTAFDSEACVADTVEWPDALIAEHARNFVFDRFALDIELPTEGHDRLYASWIRNSLTSPRKRVLHIGRNFVTFSEEGEGFKIDLLSVLDRRQGIGRRLLNSLISLAKDTSRACVMTVTECENRAAVRLYCQTGYRLSNFQTVFHCVEPRRATSRRVP